MKDTKKYFGLGLFIVIATVILLGAIAILAGPNFFRPKVTLETYFINSISGLEVGSPVKFRGIQVGQVKEILLSTEAYPQANQDILSEKDTVAVVRMELYFPKTTDWRTELLRHIQNGLRVQTQLAGITGSLYLSIEFLSPQKYPSDRIKFDWEPKYGYIPSAPSLSNEIIENVKSFLAGLDKLDLDKRLKEIEPVLSSLIDNLNNISKKLDPTSFNNLTTNIDSLVKTTNKKIDTFDVEALNKLITQLDSSAGNLSQFTKDNQFQNLSASLIKLSNRLDGVIKNNQYDLHQAILNLDRAMTSLNVLLRELNNNPRQFLLGPSNSNVLDFNK